MASLKQIAAELGVSHVLVSRVLSGRMGTTGASAKTREAILKKAAELDYRPNRLAVALKKGRSGVIGVFLHQMGIPGSEVTPVFLSSLAKALDRSAYRLWLRFFETDEEFLAAFDEKLRNEADGLIVGGTEHPGLFDKLRKIDRDVLPVVTVYCELPGRLTNVAVDYEAQCYLATKHLLEMGCRHLAHFRVFDSRYNGFVRAHREAGLPVQRRLVMNREPGEFPFFVKDGERFTKRLLAAGVPFDGIVAESDEQAVGAVRTLLLSGVRVPEDVKVTGVDNSPLSENAAVPLTSATTEMDVCGRVAVELLQRKIEKKPAESAVIAPRLVVRASTRQ